MWTLAATKEGLWGLPAAGHGRVWHWLSPSWRWSSSTRAATMQGTVAGAAGKGKV